MRKITFGIVALMSMLLMFSFPVYADGRRGHGKFFIGAGHRGWGGHYHSRWRHHWHGPRFHWGGVVVLRPWPVYPYEYYSPPPVIIREEAPLYVEPEEEGSYYWYYCQEAQGYYPYVRTCPGGWLKVVPDTTPPGR
jgi:hypothetical protein